MTTGSLKAKRPARRAKPLHRLWPKARAALLVWARGFEQTAGAAAPAPAGRAGAALAALCLLLCLTACAAPEAPASSLPEDTAQSGTALPADAKSAEGMVLDATGGLLILRTADSREYVFRSEDAQDCVEGGVTAGLYVRVWYSGTLEQTNARNVRLLRIEAASETPADTLSFGSTAEGFLTFCSGQTLTLQTTDGAQLRFYAPDKVREVSGELREGVWVRVLFDGVPGAAVVSRVTESAGAPDVFTLVGTLRGQDEEAGTLTFSTEAGGWYTFAQGDAEIDAPDGLWSGSRRYVVSYRGSISQDGTEHAVLLRVQAERLAEQQAVEGTVCAVTEEAGLLELCTADGRVLAFYPGAAVLSGEGGVTEGDYVRIRYTGCIDGTGMAGVRITALEVISRGGAHENSVLGEVRSVNSGTLVLAAADGRTLRFSPGAGKTLPEELTSGERVRVAYTGWIADEETEHAAYVSVSRAYG